MKSNVVISINMDSIYSNEESAIIEQAKSIIVSKFKMSGDCFTQPDLVKNYVQLSVSGLSVEVFGVLFLNQNHELICDEIINKGTIDAASVYPRDIVKRALELNASGCIFYHNHPSGNNEPSQADRRITRRITDALNTVDIRVLDHIVAGVPYCTSFAERGWI